MDNRIIGNLSLGVSGYKSDGKVIDTWQFSPPEQTGKPAKIDS